MKEHVFQLRLSCRYEDPDNSIADLRAEVLAGGQWEKLLFSVRTPGFLLLSSLPGGMARLARSA
jgi:hypothetical protein